MIKHFEMQNFILVSSIVTRKTPFFSYVPQDETLGHYTTLGNL